MTLPLMFRRQPNCQIWVTGSGVVFVIVTYGMSCIYTCLLTVWYNKISISKHHSSDAEARWMRSWEPWDTRLSISPLNQAWFLRANMQSSSVLGYWKQSMTSPSTLNSDRWSGYWRARSRFVALPRSRYGAASLMSTYNRSSHLP
jgi:hypothetical protein